MNSYIIRGGKSLKGEISVSGAKNVAMKVILAGLLTSEELKLSNIPLISSVYGTLDIVNSLGLSMSIDKTAHTLILKGDNITGSTVSFELGALYRTATMVMGPLLARFGKARVPNPGGCRIGKRPIDRHIEGLKAMGAIVKYKDGFFDAEVKGGLKGVTYTFPSNSHTGTETLILAGVLAKGETVLKNAAEEPEVDDLIALLNGMGAKIKRKEKRTIVIEGVKELHGYEHSIMPDRNEVVTFAVSAYATGGDVLVKGVDRLALKSFFDSLDEANAPWEEVSPKETRFYFKNKRLTATHVTTGPHPMFMTDWQAPWAVLMTQAEGRSTIHETVYEDRFGYVQELKKMGADIHFFDPKVKNPESVYNFNWNDKRNGYHQAIEIKGPTSLHNGIMEVCDLRAGATLVLGALTAPGQSTIYGIDHIDRGYEDLEGRLRKLGADIIRKDEIRYN